MTRRPHLSILILLAAALFLRALVPTGWMPAPERGAFAIQPCPAAEFAPVRADPRFIPIAARMGLVRYWRTSGKWPDFCTNEQLKYDCKTEAAKYPR